MSTHCFILLFLFVSGCPPTGRNIYVWNHLYGWSMPSEGFGQELRFGLTPVRPYGLTPFCTRGCSCLRLYPCSCLLVVVHPLGEIFVFGITFMDGPCQAMISARNCVLVLPHFVLGVALA
ncbi:unnamed protein product [Prunus armeniaca]